MKEIHELVATIRRNYGRTLEIASALNLARSKLESIGDIRDPEAYAYFGKDDPNSPEATTTYYLLNSEYDKNIADEGPIIRWARNAAILSIYEHWNHQARPALAQVSGLDTDKFLRPIWGDVRHLRNACGHSDNKLLKSLMIFDFFDKGEVVSFSEEAFELLIYSLLADCEELADQVFGEKHRFPFRLRIQ